MKKNAYKFPGCGNILRSILIALPVLAVFSLLSCSEDDAGSLAGFCSEDIRFTVNVGNGAQTRAGQPEEPRCTDVNIYDLKSPDGEKYFLEEAFDGFLERQAVDDAPVTRGMPVETLDALGDFSTYCYHADGTAYYENIAVGNDGIPKELKDWPEGEALRFYAVHPYDASASGFSPSAEDFKYTYTVSTDVPSQSDLMYVSTDMLEWNDNRLAPLYFRHALAPVKVKIGTVGSSITKINSITFKNVKTKGTLTLPATSTATSDAIGTWELDNSTEYTKNLSVTGLNITNMRPDTEINAGENTFLMLPQSLGDETTLEIGVTFNDNTDYTFTFPLSGGNDWEAGKTRTYTFTTAAIMAVNYPEGWTDTTSGSSVQSPITEYDQQESFGLFSVNPSTGEVVLSNVEVKNTAAGSASSLKLDNTKFYAYGNTYFLYYPYRSDVSIGTPSGYDTAEHFFSDLIANWDVSTTQNSLPAFKAQDLQTAMLDYSNHQFTMEHQMGLAQLQTTVSIEDTWVWTYSSQTTHDVYTESIEDPDEVTIDKSKFNAATKTRLYDDESGMWTIVRATGSSTNESVDFGCNFTNDDVQLFIDGTDVNNDEWSATENGIGYGKHKEIAPSINHIPRKFRADFNYNENKTYYQITLPRQNQTYKLETWGAGLIKAVDNIPHGRGGYTFGNYNYVDTELYVCVGGRPISGNLAFGGYNGGGTSYTGTSSGGVGGCGATHIADVLVGDGTLRAYHSETTTVYYTQREYILMVAGGAGGYDGSKEYGGDGGGGDNSGGDGSNSNNYGGKGGSTTLPGNYGKAAQGAFGKGGNAQKFTEVNGKTDYGSGGGAGWYGGGGCASNTPSGGGGGGSGHIHSNKIANGGGTTGGNTESDYGRARISWPAPTN